ncbi:MAG: UbiD family decarboxylase [Thermoguttaceae bacterium]|jgi:4-hydroxy-3-polyprenylbenzoate decarboxylase|nr:UbiD family decarboxylase [Thermoguttaceae bacterium]
MGYRTLRDCLLDLRSAGHLVAVDASVDANLEAAEIQRRLFRAGGPAVLLENVRGCAFPMVCNLFGTMDRMRYLFRDTLEGLRQLVSLQADPADLLRRPRLYLKTPWSAWNARPRRVRRGPVLANETTLSRLPQLKSWPDDGGPYITLPQVYTEDPDRPGLDHSNLGMYRVQLAGGQYEPDREAGMHYQLQRGIGVHHATAIRRDEPLRVNVFVGGPPAMSVAAVMPLPEGMSELSFAGVLGGRRVPMICRDGQLPIHAEADFCISGYLDPETVKPEGPFGDHLGYYSLAHEFPVLKVERVYHRNGAVWPFTVVGRPPQEDTMFGQLIHELVGPVLDKKVPGVRAVHAVDAAGVHPLLLAIGSERYVPYEKRRRPRELLTQANALLGQGQLSLAKYLFIAAEEDGADLSVQNIPEFFRHVLERGDWRRDLHFQTCTTIDTLDYTGTGLNQGSKLVIAATGPPVRSLAVAIDSRVHLPDGLGFSNPRVFLPGILVVSGPPYRHDPNGVEAGVARFCQAYKREDAINGFPLIVVVDDSAFTARNLENFLWTTFTRSNPASDVHGIEPFEQQKHWGCLGALVIDARSKPHHAPPLIEDPAVTRRVDELAARGGPLHGLW